MTCCLQFLIHGKKQPNTCDTHKYLQTAVIVMFMQMQATKGFKPFVKRAVAAIIKELKKIHNGSMPGKRVVAPIEVDTLTAEDKIKSLDSVNIIKEK